MQVRQILKLRKSRLISGGDIDIDHFAINTNDIDGKTMFFPLKGNTDGHNYILNGVENGIAGFFTEPGHENIIKKALKINKNLIIIEVPDTLKALQNLAKQVRKSINIPVIALTGSFGKTSQREMIFSVLKQEFKVLTTKGNLNNHIGMPLTLVNYKDEEVVLLELGTNHMGEIAFLRDICRPTITLVTNIGTAHIGNFKTIKNTFKEKMSISKNSKYFLKNVDDNLIKKANVKANIIEYGVKRREITYVKIGNISTYTYNFRGNKYKVSINSDIDYLVNYSVCAFKIGLLLQMNIKNIIKGISLFKPAPSRMERITRGKHIVINDCYNASYETMISGLDYFEKQPVKDKIVILGDILELGLQSSKIHMDIAKYIAKKKFNFDEIHLVGPEMKCVYTYLNKKGFNVRYYKKVEAVSKAVLRGKSAYLKASHGIGLYKLLEKD